MNSKKYFLFLFSAIFLGLIPILLAGDVAVAKDGEVIVPSFVRFVTTIFGQEPGDPADFFLFVGRFHPLVLHLPIGMLVVAFFMQAFSIWKKRDDLHFPYCFCLGCSFIFSVLAVIFGALLSMSNEYNADLINRHGWGGILFSLLVGLAFYLKYKFLKSGQENMKQKKASLVVMFIALNVMSLVGHDGGSLTHGPDYLTDKAPNILRNLIGLPDKPKEVVNPEGTVYNEIIAKFFAKNCTSCHSDAKTKGKLRLDTIEWIQKGGKNKDLIIHGNADASLLVELMTTDDEDEIMPPKGKLSNPHIELIKWWINTSSSDADLFERLVKDAKVPPKFIQMFDKEARKAAHVKKAEAVSTKSPESTSIKLPEVKEAAVIQKPKVTPEASGGINFVKDVAPILEARCVKCHGEKKQKGEYRLDKGEHIFIAGESEETPVFKGKAAESYLHKLISLDEDDDDVMPPKGGNLTSEQIAIIGQWIKEGATFPEGIQLQDRSKKK